MIKFENLSVYGWEPAIRGMRNPMNSWNLRDSEFDEYDGVIAIGPKDEKLMKTLVRAGSDHRKFLRMINCYIDITAPLYWWKEFDTYKVGTVANSCSTMHKIANKKFTEEDFSTDHLSTVSKAQLGHIVIILNGYRDLYKNWDAIDDNSKNAWQIYDKKEAWWQMIQLLPSSYNQKRTVMLNYETLRNIYFARRHHKLDEWREFCSFIEEQLPESWLITLGKENEEE